MTTTQSRYFNKSNLPQRQTPTNLQYIIRIGTSNIQRISKEEVDELPFKLVRRAYDSINLYNENLGVQAAFLARLSPDRRRVLEASPIKVEVGETISFEVEGDLFVEINAEPLRQFLLTRDIPGIPDIIGESVIHLKDLDKNVLPEYLTT